MPVGYIGVGILGFLVAPLFEVLSLNRTQVIKQFVGALAAGLIVFATVMVGLRSERLGLPIWLTSLGWIFLAVSVFLLIYSLFVELPMRRTYIAPGVADTLVKTGTYALVRHPGVLWYALLLISLILTSKARLLLIASPVWLVADVLYVFVQEKFFFGKMFAGYDEYRRETPMLVPNRESVGACLRTLRLAKTRGQVGGRSV